MASGPFATAILGDQGADVVKVEPPGHGDLLRALGATRGGLSAIFNTINRSKRSLVLDLSRPEGVALLDRLADRADVFVQNFRPGTAERMGLGADRLRERNPRLVYVSISGFGEEGPLAGRPVYDSVMQAYSGVAASQADPATGEPQFVRNIVCDKGTALTVAQAVTAALLAREREGVGQHVRLSMLHASVAFLWPDAMQNHTYLGGEVLPMGRATLPAIRATADGHVTFTAINDDEFRRLCTALEREDLLADPRFAEAGNRVANAGDLHEVLDPIARSMTTAELVRRLEAERVPHAVVNDLASLHEDPQIVANDVLVEQEHPSAGPQRQPRPVPRFDATPAAVQRPAPQLGEHTEEVLSEAGVSDDEIAALRASGVLG
jgi:crotonobetainyl-CoA:carnitine CoA-transferase CaiB-like acyl-CoA transferase